ncbi:MAG: aldose 1-epimerase [Anaerolineae bacterium]|nr:aldose 1-epimerase [Anaerolineae bacterium]
MAEFTYSTTQDPHTGSEIIRLNHQSLEGQTSLSFLPEVGCNLISFQVDGQEYLCGFSPQGRLLGTPILYPTPNRVKNARFVFQGKTYHFPANDGPHFIHGLVRNIPWEWDTPSLSEEQASITCHIAFTPGTELFHLFPFHNVLELTYTLRPRAIRLEFTIHNTDTWQPLPFGLAIHPYFNIIGSRADVRIQVPAKKWMEAIKLIPTGRLVDLTDAPADLRKPTSLDGLDVDDVFWGMTPEHPQVIFYDAIGKKLSLRASEIFTHSVVYTPQGKPFFCLENQSCSTDAHNLYARGLGRESHLIILEPGAKLSAWVEFLVQDL